MKMSNREYLQQTKEIIALMCTMFEEYCDSSVLVITDKLVVALINIYGYDLDELDRRKPVKEVYQTLAYHHNLYRSGKSRKEWFISICEDCKRGV